MCCIYVREADLRIKCWYNHGMIEARVFVDNLEGAQKILAAHKAVPSAQFSIHDTIYRNIDVNIPLIDEFLRLRVVPDNIWPEKPVILALKQTRLRTIGKQSEIPLKLQFDKREDAEAYYTQHLEQTYVKDFDFWRIGWQYHLPNGDVVDLEIVENKYPTIEIKSETDDGMRSLCELFGIARNMIITGPSVVAVRKLLLSQGSS